MHSKAINMHVTQILQAIKNVGNSGRRDWKLRDHENPTSNQGEESTGMGGLEKRPYHWFFLQSHMHRLIFEAFIAFPKFHESVHTIFQSFKLGVLLNYFLINYIYCVLKYCVKTAAFVVVRRSAVAIYHNCALHIRPKTRTSLSKSFFFFFFCDLKFWNQ